MQTIKVKSAFPQQEDKGYPLAIFERHRAHENGELFIADAKVHEVALTAGVRTALNENRLVEVDGSGEVDETDETDEEAIAKFAKDHTRDELVAIATEKGLEVPDSANKLQIAEEIINS